MNTPTNSISWCSCIVAACLLTACYGEDMSDCPPVPDDSRTVTLHFDLGGDYADDAFTERVQTVNVGIYNAAGDSIGNRQVTADELSAFTGVELKLPGGDYSFVCWGNIDDDDNDDGVITYQDNHDNDAPLKGGELGDIHPDLTDAGDSDPLWHGQTRSITVPADDDLATTIPFLPKYWELEFFLNGSLVEDGHEFVELINLPDGMNVATATLDTETITSSYELTESRNVDNKNYEFADFRTFRFDPYNNNITLVIETYADAHELYRVRLQDIMPKGLDLQQDIIVPLLLTIEPTADGKDVSVTIGMPDWKSETPGWSAY